MWGFMSVLGRVHGPTALIQAELIRIGQCGVQLVEESRICHRLGS